MRTAVKEALQPVIDLLNKNNLDSRDLWAILCALRGPDNGDTYLKEETTERFRFALGIKPLPEDPVCKLYLRQGEISGPGGMLLSKNPLPSTALARGFQTEAEVAAESGGRHFALHFREATDALAQAETEEAE